jgi:hypothetical protein
MAYAQPQVYTVMLQLLRTCHHPERKAEELGLPYILYLREV